MLQNCEIKVYDVGTNDLCNRQLTDIQMYLTDVQTVHSCIFGR